MRLKSLVAAVAVASTAPAFAAISPGAPQTGANLPYNGNGELFLTVFDSGAKISYTLDLGVTQNDFFAAAQGLDAGYSRNWAVGDANFTSFLGQSSVASLQWAVLAIDQTGGTTPGGVRLFSTLKNGQASEFPLFTNQLFSQGMGSTQAGTFFNAINTTGTHGAVGQALNYGVNGSSVNKDADSGNSYFGDGSVGLSSNLNGNAPFSVANAVGESSAFYYIRRSSTNQLDSVAFSTFANRGGDAVFSFADTGSGYALNYALAPVPEPESLALLLAGLGVVGMVVRRRRID